MSANVFVYPYNVTSHNHHLRPDQVDTYAEQGFKRIAAMNAAKEAHKVQRLEAKEEKARRKSIVREEKARRKSSAREGSIGSYDSEYESLVKEGRSFS